MHQVVRDMQGKVIADQVIRHVYSFEGGLVKKMEIQK